MGGLFSSQKSNKQKSRITEQDKAILQLKQQRDKIKMYQKRIETSLEKDRQLAKKCLEMGRKDRAKSLLRKKKYQEKLLENTDVQLETLEKLTSDIEFALVERQIIDGLKVGNEALKKIHEVLSIDEVEQILDETRESVEKQNEIDSIISGFLTSEDEDDIINELEKLIEDEAEKEAEPEKEKESNITDLLPDVPTEDPVKNKKRREQEPNARVALEA